MIRRKQYHGGRAGGAGSARSFFTLLCYCTLFALATAPSARAGLGRIGVNFYNLDYGGTVSNSWLAPSISAGVVAHTNWNNVHVSYYVGGWVYETNLVTSAGENVPMTLIVDGAEIFGEVRTTDDQTNTTARLLNGRLSGFYGMNFALSAQDVPFEIYDVYVYVSGPPSTNATITITSDGYTGPRSYYLKAGDPTSFTSFSRVTSTNPASPTRANYVRFSNVEDSSFSISFEGGDLEEGTVKRVYGLQLIEVAPTKQDGAMIFGR